MKQAAARRKVRFFIATPQLINRPNPADNASAFQ